MEARTARLEDIISPFDSKIVRKLRDMREIFYFKDELNNLDQNKIVYEVYEFKNNDLNLSLTLLYPGKVGNEYFMTKGHYHEKEVGEIYYCIKGRGLLVMQSRKGEVNYLELEKGTIAYVPPNYAHRVVNISDEVLSFLAFYTSDAGHDYKSIEKEGFKVIVIEVDGKPEVKFI